MIWRFTGLLAERGHTYIGNHPSEKKGKGTMAENALQNVETIFETGGIVLGGSAGFAGAVAQRKHKRKVHPEGETLTSDQLMEEKLEEELQIGDIETRDDDTSIKVETAIIATITPLGLIN